MPYDPERMKEILRQAEESLKKQRNGHPASSGPEAKPPQPIEPVEPLPVSTIVDLHQWRYHAGLAIKDVFDKIPEEDRPTVASIKDRNLIEHVVKEAREVIKQHQAPYWPTPAGVDVDAEIRELAQRAIDVFRDVYQLPVDKNLPAVIAFEAHELALQANLEYLKRTPVIEGLFYSSSVSMITGGKHAGKSTITRWLAICVAKGLDFLGRKVDQGPVLYLASEDESMAARQELLRLGWNPTDPLLFLSMANVELDQLRFLQSLTDHITKNAVRLIVMDMLFDFAHITDELSYSQTREAVGTIQRVATAGDCHVVTVHHSPKHLVTADAAVTALGSQGLAARVSPIMLVRKHGENVHSLVTTSVRDPRGQGIEEMRLLRNEDGSLVLGKPWRDYMQSEVFKDKVLQLFEADPGEELSRADVQEALAISQQLASACLRLLYKEGKLDRAGSGKKGKPFRYSLPAQDGVQEPQPEIRPANDPPTQMTLDPNGTQGKDPCTILPDPDEGEDWEKKGIFKIKPD